jgi:hypothetical protein
MVHITTYRHKDDVLATGYFSSQFFSHVSPPLLSSGQSSWLQIHSSGFDSRRYQIFWEVIGLERGPLSLLITIEELLGRNSSGSGLERREYDRWNLMRWPRDTFCSQKLALTSLTSGGRSVGIVRSRTKATKLLICLILDWCILFSY